MYFVRLARQDEDYLTAGDRRGMWLLPPCGQDPRILFWQTHARYHATLHVSTQRFNLYCCALLSACYSIFYSWLRSSRIRSLIPRKAAWLSTTRFPVSLTAPIRIKPHRGMAWANLRHSCQRLPKLLSSTFELHNSWRWNFSDINTARLTGFQSPFNTNNLENLRIATAPLKQKPFIFRLNLF